MTDIINIPLRQLEDDARALIQGMRDTVKNDKGHEKISEALILKSLFAKMLSHAEATMVLLDNKCEIEAEIITRSLLEALFYYGACLRDSDAPRNYMHKDLFEAKSSYEFYIKKPEYIQEEGFSEEKLKSDLKILEEQIRARKLEKLSVHKAAKLAGLESLYKDYCILCWPTHSSPNSLYDDVITRDGNDITVNTFPTPERREEIRAEIFRPFNTALACAGYWYREHFAAENSPSVTEIERRYIQINDQKST